MQPLRLHARRAGVPPQTGTSTSVELLPAVIHQHERIEFRGTPNLGERQSHEGVIGINWYVVVHKLKPPPHFLELLRKAGIPANSVGSKKIKLALREESLVLGVHGNEDERDWTWIRLLEKTMGSNNSPVGIISVF